MSIISLSHVNRTYRVHARASGAKGLLLNAFKRETKTIRAVDDVSFSLEEGELVGYIGPNGAGKSTTVKLMSGILKPDSGEISVLGREPWRERKEHVRHIGVVFGQRSQLWWDTPVIDSFSVIRDIYAVPHSQYKQTLDDLCDILQVGEFLQTPVRQLSLGQRMRCELIAAMLHQPQVLFLDEPTIGLDAVTKLALRAFLKQVNRERGTTMILTTHDMDDMEALCSRVMLIGRGKLLFDGSLDTMRAEFAPWRTLKIRLGGEISSCPGIEGAESVEYSGQEARIRFLPSEVSAQEMIARTAALLPVADLTVEAPDIDLLVADMYRRMQL